MLNCRTLSLFFGRDTRAVQWANFILTIIWVVVLVVDYLDYVPVNIPGLVKHQIEPIMSILGFNLIFSTVGFLTMGKLHQMMKVFAFMLGAMVWAVIANGYVTAYPPLDMMLFVSTALSLWFFAAVFYVIQCEGIDGTNKTTY